MFLRYFATFILLAHTNGQKAELLGNIFSQTSLSNKTLEAIKCNDIQGTLQDCYDCYTCDQVAVSMHRSRGDNIRTLKLIDDSCDATEVCCISQRSLTYSVQHKYYRPKLYTPSQVLLSSRYSQ